MKSLPKEKENNDKKQKKKRGKTETLSLIVMHINCSCFVARQLAMQMSFELHDRRFVVFPLFLFSFFAALSKIKLKYIFFAAEMHRLRTASVHWSIRPSVCPSVRFRLCMFSHTIDRQHNNNNNITTSVRSAPKISASATKGE